MIRCGNTRERSPGTASFKVGMILFLQRRSSGAAASGSLRRSDEDLAVAEHVESCAMFAVLDRVLNGFVKFLDTRIAVGVVCLVFF